MRNNLTLITTETFGDLSCNFYRNINDEVLLTREQIGQALEYKYPDDALSKIHKRHSNRLDPLSVVAKMASTDGKYYDTTLYTQRGIMEICRWSNKSKADTFMDWVWDIVEKYRANELVPIQSSQADLTPLVDMLSVMTQSITSLTNNMISMQQDIQSIKDVSTKKKLPEKKYSRWKTNTFSKLNTLLSYVNTHSDENLSLPNIIHLIIAETEDTYGIEVNDYVDAYKSEFDLDTNPYAIDVINHYKDIKDMFTLTLDSILEKLHLSNNTTKSKSKNIFDELAAQLEN